MCGRYTLAAELDAVADLFSVDAGPLAADYQPRWNVAPGQDVLVVTGNEASRQGRFMHWGFPARLGSSLGRGPWINARSESVSRRPAFRDAFRTRRCLVPADGFFEWEAVPGRPPTRQPYWLRPQAGDLFAMAGIWQPTGPARTNVATSPRADGSRGAPGSWRPSGPAHALTSRGGLAVLTQAAPRSLEWLHERVPVILPPSAWDDWLSQDAPEPLLLLALAAAEPLEFVARPVSRAVNNARFDAPECIEEAPQIRQEQPSLF